MVKLGIAGDRRWGIAPAGSLHAKESVNVRGKQRAGDPLDAAVHDLRESLAVGHIRQEREPLTQAPLPLFGGKALEEGVEA